MEDSKYENIIAKYDERQLCFERAILLKQYNITRKQLAMVDDEMKRRLEENK